MKIPSKKEKSGLWKAHHSDAWKASGLTQQAYCEQVGISYRSFIYQHNRMERDSQKSPLHFIEAKRSPPIITPEAGGLELILPNGIRIIIGSAINPALLQTVLSTAGAVPCLS
jgi:hypothetical protein